MTTNRYLSFRSVIGVDTVRLSHVPRCDSHPASARPRSSADSDRLDFEIEVDPAVEAVDWQSGGTVRLVVSSFGWRERRCCCRY